MTDIKQLADAIYRERVERARRTPPEEKLLDGPRLFEMACRITMDGIRDQFPDTSEEDVRRILADRLELRNRLEKKR